MAIFREYNPVKDISAVKRIWNEVSWIDGDTEEKMLEIFLSEAHALVADQDGEAECLVCSAPGTIRYLEEDVDLSIVTAVITSRIARKQGLAKALTARLIAEDAAKGAKISILGVFEQGFYDQLGFGSGGYEHWIRFDPAQLMVDNPKRTPKRLTKDDWKDMHRAMLSRYPNHGSCSIFPPSFLQAELGWTKKGFGLGYYDGEGGTLSHFMWMSAHGESGPVTLRGMAFQTYDQFLELMSVLKSLGDQIRKVRFCEPVGIQMQDLLRHPFRHKQITEKSDFEHCVMALAYWQARILDLEGCLAQTHLNNQAVSFNLELSDPVEEHIPEEIPWKGLRGTYVVTLGPVSKAERGSKPGLPTLRASIGAFTRMWLGVRPASGPGSY